MGGTALLVHPGWSGPDDWRWVAAPLRDVGVAVSTPDLPSHQRAGATRAEDVDVVHEALDGAAGPVVVVGWSYGTTVVTDLDLSEGDRAAKVVALLYLTALPGSPPAGPGEQAPGSELDPAHLVFDDGLVAMDERWFLEENPAILSLPAEVRDHLRAHPRRPLSLDAVGPQVRAAWSLVPTTVLLGRDDTLHPEANQRWALEHFEDVRLVDSDHFLGWRDPGMVVEVILELLARG